MQKLGCAHAPQVPGPIHVVSIDGRYVGETLDEGTFVHAPISPPEPQVTIGIGERPRLEFIRARLADGIACAQIDLDVIFTRDIADLFAIDADFIVSRASSFPRFMRRAHGFVACMGFFIAKPGAARFCDEVLSTMSGRSGWEGTDQYVTNEILFGALQSGRAILADEKVRIALTNATARSSATTVCASASCRPRPSHATPTLPPPRTGITMARWSSYSRRPTRKAPARLSRQSGIGIAHRPRNGKGTCCA
jgi:hypothetical protein